LFCQYFINENFLTLALNCAIEIVLASKCVLTASGETGEKTAKSHSSSDSAGSKVGAIYLKAFSTHELEKKGKKSS
jgi:hypothetical protein